jgi:hypothetical protein
MVEAKNYECNGGKDKYFVSKQPKLKKKERKRRLDIDGEELILSIFGIQDL